MRQTSAQIDHAILDVAAGIFATHGFAHTSVQQIADAVGYSKPGLLHRFGSKEALHRSVLDEVTATAQELLAYAQAQAGRPDRTVRVLQELTRLALARPGMMQLLLAAFDPATAEPGIEPVRRAAHRLVDALDQPLGTPADRLRVRLALDLIVTAALLQRSASRDDLQVAPEQLVTLLVTLASSVLARAHGTPV